MPNLAINAGELRHKVQVQAQASGRDDFGQPLDSWDTVCTTWAKISALTEREYFQSGQFASHFTHTITIRWPGSAVTIVPGMRVVYGSHVYLIQNPDNVDERDTIVKLMALEINGGLNA